MSPSSVDNKASGDSWGSFIRSFHEYARGRQINPKILEDVIGEANVRIAKMVKAGRMPPKGPKAMFDFAYRTVLQSRKREQNRLKRISEASSSVRICTSKRDHTHPNPRLVARTLLLCRFSEKDEAIIRSTCLSDDQPKSKCPEGLARPTNRDHAKKFGVSHQKIDNLVSRFKKELRNRRLVEDFLKLEKLDPPSESPKQWSKFLRNGFLLGEIAMILDTADVDKSDVGYAIAKHLPHLCEMYANLVMRTECLEAPEPFNVLLSVEELLFLGCRYAPRWSKDYILNMCEVLKKHQQASPFFIERLLRLLPAYCARQDEEEHWQDLWHFYQMEENDRQFSLDALHHLAYNHPDSTLWHRSKDILLERSNKMPEDVYRFPGKGIEYTLHALKAAVAYKKNPALQRMSLYWAWEYFRLLPLDTKQWSELYTAVEKLSCYQENKELQDMLLNRFRQSN